MTVRGRRDLLNMPSLAMVGARDASVPNSLLRAVREMLSPTPVRVDEIVRAVDTPHRLVLAALAELELAGEAVAHVGGTASRAV
jgi:DNA processing protein